MKRQDKNTRPAPENPKLPLVRKNYLWLLAGFAVEAYAIMKRF